MARPTLLAIAPVQSQSGYGKHSADLVRCLINMNKFDVKILPLRWGNTPLNGLEPGKDDDIISRILPNPQLQKQPEIVFQVTVPNEFNPIGQYNIGVTAGIETTIAPASWIEGMNRMNINIVPSNFTKKTFMESMYTKNAQGTNQPIGQLKLERDIDVIFEGCDTNIYRRIDEKDISQSIKDKLSFVTEDWAFLMVGHWLQGNMGHDRKDIGMTFKVFFEAFKNKPNPPALIAKISSATFSVLDRDEMLKRIHEIKLSIADATTLPNVYLLHGQLTDVEMNELYNHPKVKAIVTLTKGEGFCVKDYTNILTENGLKRIDNIQLGDNVLTHRGNFKPVTSLLQRKYTGDMYNIEVFNGFSHETVFFTPNHNILSYNRQLNLFNWKRADELTQSDYVCMPKFNNSNNNITSIKIYDYVNNIQNIVLNENNIIEYSHSDKTNGLHPIENKELKLDANLGKLIGYYLAEGTADGTGIYFSLHLKEEDTIAKEIINLFKILFNIDSYEIIKVDKTSKLIIKFYSKIISNFLISFCGKYSYGKFINEIIFKSNHEFKSNLISSLLLVDAEIKGGSISLSLVNENIIKNIRLLLLEMNIISNFDFRDIIKMNVYSKIKHKHDVFRIRIVKNDSVSKLLELINKNHIFSNYNLPDATVFERNKLSINLNDYMVFQIKKINKENYNGIVYNISVKDDESYCLQNFVVHNCRPLLEFSMCGKPIIASGWSGHMDFLDKDLTVLLPGKIDRVHESSVNDFILKDSQWFTADYNTAAAAMIDVFTNYSKYLSNAKKMSYYNKNTYSLDMMQRKLEWFFEKNVPEFPEELELKLPTSVSKLKTISLPKMKKAGDK